MPASSARPVLVVDDRQDDRFTRALGEYFDVKVKHLKTGDLVWSCPLGSVGVEDKCMPDLLASLQNKRLDDELRRLIDGYAVPILFIRGHAPWGNKFTAISADSLEKLKFGRQLHGIYVWQAGETDEEAAASLAELYKYLLHPRTDGIDGVRRERKFAFGGPLGPRAEVIYGILGMTSGVRNRRSIALSIAQATPLSAFMRWDAWDFEAAGFSRHMAAKLVGVLRQLEEPPSPTKT